MFLSEDLDFVIGYSGFESLYALKRRWRKVFPGFNAKSCAMKRALDNAVLTGATVEFSEGVGALVFNSVRLFLPPK